MAITTAVTVTHLTRANLWSTYLKEVLQDELYGQGFVNWLTDFPDGTTFNIPSIGEGTIRNYVENTPVVYDALDTGNFTFTITDYVQSGMYITEQVRQDSFYASQVEASFVPKQARALAEYLETAIFALAKSGQTEGDLNTINNVEHRFVGNADPNADTIAGNALALGDFARAAWALKKANVPDTGLIAIVDPITELNMNLTTNIVNVSNNPMWEGIITSGIGRGPRFIRNIYGFDVYVSNYLPTVRAAGETLDSQFAVSKVATTAYIHNIFMSASDKSLLPFVGAWRQPPKVDSEYNKDFQREEYVTTARFGLKGGYRPENLVVVLTPRTLS